MELSWIDLLVFIAFMLTVVGVSLYAGRRERTSEDYFLAGRKLTWYLIGFSLIASNISTEHFVGMAGSAFSRIGLAIASFEWTAAVTLVFVAWFLLPRFLKAGIYTMPQFLEYRYDAQTRTIMSIFVMVAYIFALLATVLYSGAIALNAVFDLSGLLQRNLGLPLEQAEQWANLAGVWGIGILAGVYTIYGGLKAVVWSDLLQGGALLIGGTIVTVLGFLLLGDGNFLAGLSSFQVANADKLHAVLPWNDPDVPSLAVFAGGMWIGHLHYWGCNQFITQRTLAAKSLAEGQKGIMLAAGLKLFLPFIVVIPGIMAYQLFGDVISTPDKAYPYMISQILPAHFRGIMFAALTGAVMSTFNSGLNSASTIFTIDIYQPFIRPHASQKALVRMGRWVTTGFVVIACAWAPIISRFQGVYMYIQELWGFIAPGILAAFLFGLILRKAPA
ncbi:solute:sodium symporter family transporter, partial [candidate division KSB1 bacterium]|nr:solute:sodium symporter family transporter [candidate division KSB1 bacterium]